MYSRPFPVSGVIVALLSLRSKRSCMKRTKFGPREGAFRIRAARKNGARAKSWKERGGEGKERNPSLSPPPPPSFQLFALVPFFRAARMRKTPSGGPNFVRFVQERLLRRLSPAGLDPLLLLSVSLFSTFFLFVCFFWYDLTISEGSTKVFVIPPSATAFGSILPSRPSQNIYLDLAW